MERHRDDFDLTTELHALRPVPRPAFAAELDARAAAGFPSRPASGTSLLRRIATLLRHAPRRQVLAPAGACAVVAIALATAVVVMTEEEPTTSRTSSMRGEKDALNSSGTSPEGTAAGSGSQSSQLSAPLRRATASPPPVGLAENAASDAGRLSVGPFASKANRRAIERSAQLVLGTEPSEVREDATRVFETVHSFDGIVLRSSIRDGSGGEAGAAFDLLIPTAKLGDALAAFSEIAEVRSRHESTADITAPTITVGEHLRDARAKVEGLLAQLADADTDSERRAVEAELRGERYRVAALRSRLSTLERRANLSHVSLRIETGAAGSSASNDEGNWGVGDAIDDAGHILGVAAGVTVIGLAVLAPLFILALLGWLGTQAWRRKSRERALD